MSLGINVQYPVARVHTQNWLVESFIKCLQLIARPLLLKNKLSLSAWGHTILHAANLICFSPIANQDVLPLHLTLDYQPNISHMHFLVVVFMFQLPPYIELKWVINAFLASMFAFNLHLLLNILSPLQVKFLLLVLQIIILMKMFSYH